MKNVSVAALLLTIGPYAFAIDGHNGIRFNMSQKDVEGKGFVCSPPKKSDTREVAVCKHMELSGTAFGVPTQNYEVSIGPDKRVARIRADLVGIRSAQDYLSLLNRVQEFFPVKDEARTQRVQGQFMNDTRRAPDNSAVSVFYAPGVQGIVKDMLAVTFMSPAHVELTDKLRAQRERENANVPASSK
jgi:hypothetical protein